MNWLKLQQRIETWEDLHTEFKAWPVRPAELAAALVAFANTDGGQLILGVTDDHRLAGVDNPDAVMQTVDQVEVRTPGGLPNSVTIEAIKLGAAHVLRNPTLYTLFSRLGLVTGVGSGVLRTIQWVREATGEEPTIVQEGNEFVMALPRRREPN